MICTHAYRQDESQALRAACEQMVGLCRAEKAAIMRGFAPNLPEMFSGWTPLAPVYLSVLFWMFYLIDDISLLSGFENTAIASTAILMLISIGLTAQRLLSYFGYKKKEASPKLYTAFIAHAQRFTDLGVAVDGQTHLCNQTLLDALGRLIERLDAEIASAPNKQPLAQLRQAFQDISMSDKTGNPTRLQMPRAGTPATPQGHSK